MTQEQTISIPGIPAALQWRGTPQQWAFDADNGLTITAGQRTDWFIDPQGAKAVGNAPALLFNENAPCLLSAYVTADSAATFDAGVLTVFQKDDVWAKICLELSPQGQMMIVSVVTKGVSDDCNSMTVPGKSAWLRIAKLETAYAFHYSPDGRVWSLIRHFALSGSPEVKMGFLAQSPTGDSLTAHFKHIAYRQQRLAEIRSGE
jgi:regulation of enolase protein 1 (concanavalin A-like superfamily)